MTELTARDAPFYSPFFFFALLLLLLFEPSFADFNGNGFQTFQETAQKRKILAQYQCHASSEFLHYVMFELVSIFFKVRSHNFRASFRDGRKTTSRDPRNLHRTEFYRVLPDFTGYSIFRPR